MIKKMRTIDGDDDSYDKIDKHWIKSWRNVGGYRHRDGDLPAIIWPDGRKEFWIDGVKQK